jgi:hypothetical protein
MYAPPTYLQELNRHPRDKNIRLHTKSHIYTVNGDSDYISVTTWNKSHFKKFNADLVIKKMMNSKKWDTSPYNGMTPSQIKTQWKDCGIKASCAGTRMHYQIECYYNDMDIEIDTLEMEYFEQFDNSLGTNLIPYRTEWMIYDPILKLAGSVDMLFTNDQDDTLHIYDWKRSKKICKTNYYDSSAITPCISHLPNCNFWHYALQLNTYKYIIEKHYQKIISKMVIVICHPNNDSFISLEIPDLSKEINDLMELRFNTLTNVPK